MVIKAGIIMVSSDTRRILVVINRDCLKPGCLKFGLPKGHIEAGESINVCASRELKEETGIVTRVFKTDPKITASETAYFLVKAMKCLEPNPQDAKEIGDSRWVPLEEIYKTDCNRGLRIIRDRLLNKKSNLMERLVKLKPRAIGKLNKKKNIKQRKYEEDICCKEPTFCITAESSSDELDLP
jgi:ADP-ribose pyrophosphatase YjhB (NUDIX family)